MADSLGGNSGAAAGAATGSAGNWEGDGEVGCRICCGTENDIAMFKPCKCRGTVGFVHSKCLKSWISSKQPEPKKGERPEAGDPVLKCPQCTAIYSDSVLDMMYGPVPGSDAAAAQRGEEQGAGNFVLAFGKHRGLKIKDCPDKYLRWLSGTIAKEWYESAVVRNGTCSCSNDSGHESDCVFRFIEGTTTFTDYIETIMSVSRHSLGTTMLYHRSWGECAVLHPEAVENARVFVEERNPAQTQRNYHNRHGRHAKRGRWSRR